MTTRQCLRDDGRPKLAFASFDDAHAMATSGKPGYHAYRCSEHGWHIGSNFSQQQRLATLSRALSEIGASA